MTLRPLNDNVLIKRRKAQEKTAGGLFLPQQAQEKSNECVVVAAGPGRTLQSGELAPLSVEPGQTVIIGKWAGTEVRFEGEDHLIIREGDIFAILED